MLAKLRFIYSMALSKKKVIKSLENLSEDLLELLHNQYPNGYESSITRITNAKREPIFVFPLETEDATYLVKVPVTKNSDGEYDVESKPDTEFEKEEGAADSMQKASITPEVTEKKRVVKATTTKKVGTGKVAKPAMIRTLTIKN